LELFAGAGDGGRSGGQGQGGRREEGDAEHGTIRT
jgi:hypothetical protein